MHLATSPLESHDCIVSGAGASRSVVACRLAENWVVSVLLDEAGGTPQVLGERAADLIRMEHGL